MTEENVDAALQYKFISIFSLQKEALDLFGFLEEFATVQHRNMKPRPVYSARHSHLFMLWLVGLRSLRISLVSSDRWFQ
jgi:hypothetical protein